MPIYGPGLALSTDAADIQPLSAASAAGSSLKAASATHVHPYPFYLVPPGAGFTQAAVQAALDAARVAGGGTVLCPPGRCVLTVAAHPVAPQYKVGLIVGANTHLVGAGRDATVFALANNQPVNTALITVAGIMNRSLLGGDQQSSLSDFTYDGNNANQGVVAAQYGIMLIRTFKWRHTRVRAVNVLGTANVGTGEGFFYETQLGGDTTYTDCEVAANAGNTATGFSADSASSVHYENCISHGLGFGHGFTHNGCRNVVHSNCHSYANGSYGFNSEVSDDCAWVTCIAGGQAAVGADGQPFTAGQSLGNTSYGFALTTATRVRLTGCVSRKNGSVGVVMVGGSDIRAVDVDASDNDIGFQLQGATDVELTGCAARRNLKSGLQSVGTSPGLRVIGGEYSDNNKGNNLPVDQQNGISLGGATTSAIILGIKATDSAALVANKFQIYGIRLENTSRGIIVACALGGNKTAPIQDTVGTSLQALLDQGTTLALFQNVVQALGGVGLDNILHLHPHAGLHSHPHGAIHSHPGGSALHVHAVPDHFHTGITLGIDISGGVTVGLVTNVPDVQVTGAVAPGSTDNAAPGPTDNENVQHTHVG